MQLWKYLSAYMYPNEYNNKKTHLNVECQGWRWRRGGNIPKTWSACCERFEPTAVFCPWGSWFFCSRVVSPPQHICTISLDLFFHKEGGGKRNKDKLWGHFGEKPSPVLSCIFCRWYNHVAADTSPGEEIKEREPRSTPSCHASAGERPRSWTRRGPTGPADTGGAFLRSTEYGPYFFH